MSATVTLQHGLVLEGRASGKVKIEVSFLHAQQQLDADVADLRVHGVRALLADRFIKTAILAGLVPDLPVEPVEPHQRPEIVKVRARFEEGLAKLRKRQADAEQAEDADAAAEAKRKFTRANDEWRRLWRAASDSCAAEKASRDAAIAPLRATVESGLLQLGNQVEVERARARDEAKTDAQGVALAFEDAEPWPEPIDGAELLAELSALFNRYLFLPEGAAEVMALWTVNSYLVEKFDHVGYLALVSPQRRSGKTTALEILTRVVSRPLPAGNITPAGIYHVIDERRPTLLVDELDRVKRDSDVWTVLNTGHSKGTPAVRVGQQGSREFATYGAKVICYIRKSSSNVPDTVEDRSIRIPLQRQPANQRRPKSRSSVLDIETQPLRSKLSRWTADIRDRIAIPHVPEPLDDRAADSWEPLLAIATAAGGGWPALAADLAVRFSADRADEDTDSDMGILLLADVAKLIETDRLDLSLGLAAEEVVGALAKIPDRPWGAFGTSRKPITATAMARLLKPYGLTSKRAGPKTARVWRYETASVREVIDLYVPKQPDPLDDE